MTWLLLAVATMATVEMFLRLPFRASLDHLRRLAGRVTRVLASRRISDHWKEWILPRYALRLLGESLRLGAWLVLAFVPFVLIGGIAEAAGRPVLSLAATGLGIGASCLVAAIHVALRRRRAAPGDYGPGARLLHRLALAAPGAAEASFDAEKALFRGRAGDATEGRHVFVAGLARAGTTILMRAFHQTGEFASLTYRDMPFVLAPNLWARISAGSKLRGAAAERAHRDGILVDFDSPEALEEVFWRVLGNGRYLRADRLVADQEGADAVGPFRDYVALVLKRYGAARYLSKNNNNLLRLATIRAAFPNATVLIPFRDPVQHASSLLRQHRHFLKLHAADPFARRYMGWLVHHEFGADHRPFVFDGRIVTGDPDTLDYWLQLWVSVYEAILARLGDGAAGCVPVSYELLCDESEAVWRGLKARSGLDPGLPLGLALSRPAPVAGADSPHLARARAVYDALHRQSRELLLG